MAETADSDGVPLVSIVLTTHRPNPYFAETLESVRAQTWTSRELIVVDDGWVDKNLLRQIVGDDGTTRIVDHPPAGEARSRNHGLAESRGSLIAFLDHDDLWHPEHLANLVAALESNPAAVVSFARGNTIDADGKTIMEGHRGPVTMGDILEGRVRPPIDGLLARRDLVIRVGGFEPLLDPADDRDLIFKLVTEGPFVFSDAVTLFYRRHDDNQSSNIVTNAEAMDRTLWLHESAAKARGDHAMARLFHDQRSGVKDYWTRAARVSAFELLRSGDIMEAKRLLEWNARFSPRGFVRAACRGAGRKLKNSVTRGDR